MDKIICLVGASGSGKTTIAKELEKEGYNIIHSYTTRKPREENEWGHTFVTGKVNKYLGFDGRTYLLINNGMIYKPIALKERYGEAYWATKEQYQGKGISIYIIDPDGAQQVKQTVDDAEVITIFLMADELERVNRLEYRLGYNYELANNKNEKDTHKREVIDRIRKDAEIFSKCQCDYVIDANREIKDILNDIAFGHVMGLVNIE